VRVRLRRTRTTTECGFGALDGRTKPAFGFKMRIAVKNWLRSLYSVRYYSMSGLKLLALKRAVAMIGNGVEVVR
ncbi:MAG TPA: hypothetical protein V6C78_11855, partial [Crinalium sp.]